MNNLILRTDLTSNFNKNLFKINYYTILNSSYNLFKKKAEFHKNLSEDFNPSLNFLNKRFY
jgi:hypothetical protein